MIEREREKANRPFALSIAALALASRTRMVLGE